MKITNLIYFIAGGLLVACSVPEKKDDKANEEGPVVEAIVVEPNPHSEGFNVEGSDVTAIMLADEVMTAMGGRKNWNNTRFLYWNFFNLRTLLWDKWKGDVRIEMLNADLDILLNVRTMEGKVRKDGRLLQNQDSVRKYLQRGKSIWINDSYWLVMPFKLKDSGVTLKYMGEDTTLVGERSDLLQMTFDQVGDTPENKYLVWVDIQTDLITQWAYFRMYEDKEPAFILPWGNYEKKGNILLSGERGDRDLTDVKVLKEVPEGIFEEFEVSLD